MIETGDVRDLGLIAGNGVYPLLLAESARKQGVQRIFAVAFRHETDPAITRYADEVQWLHLGQLGRMLEILKASGIHHVVMAGQITPTHLFSVRMDKAMLALLARLRERNAHTIFGAVAQELRALGIELMPAYRFMESTMPAPGLLTQRSPTDSDHNDIQLGLRVAKATSGLNIGQTVVIKAGTILAVEAFEGTDETILRGGRLGGPGAVVVKVAKPEHDMRFDIPVIGLHTIRLLWKIRSAALAVEARRTILLEREKVIQEADRRRISVVAVEAG